MRTIGVLFLCLIGGCAGMQTEQGISTSTNNAAIFTQLDAIAQSIKPFTEAVEKIINTPVADMLIPAPVKKGLYIAGANLLALGGWYMNNRKNVFKHGFNELAETSELFLTESVTGNRSFDVAAKQIIKAPTRRLLKKQGFENLINNKTEYEKT